MRYTETTTGQPMVVPVSRSGASLTFWGPPSAGIEDGFRDQSGLLLMTLAHMPNGGWLAVPVDQYLRPTFSLVAIVEGDHEMRFNRDEAPVANVDDTLAPDTKPITTEKDMSSESGPPWFTQALRAARRDKFGNLMMKHVQTADGTWANLVVGEGLQPIRFLIEPEEYGAQPGAGLKSSV